MADRAARYDRRILQQYNAFSIAEEKSAGLLIVARVEKVCTAAGITAMTVASASAFDGWIHVLTAFWTTGKRGRKRRRAGG